MVLWMQIRCFKSIKTNNSNVIKGAIISRKRENGACWEDPLVELGSHWYSILLSRQGVPKGRLFLLSSNYTYMLFMSLYISMLYFIIETTNDEFLLLKDIKDLRWNPAEPLENLKQDATDRPVIGRASNGSRFNPPTRGIFILFSLNF